MNITERYYYIIIGIGLFIMFALVGYLVEITKKNKEMQKEKIKEKTNIDNTVINNNEFIETKSEEVSIDSDILNK